MQRIPGHPTATLTLAAATLAILACSEPRGDSSQAAAADDVAGSGDVRLADIPLPRARPLADTAFLATGARVERGRYLAEGVVRCVECHSPRDTTQSGWPPVEGMELAGRLFRHEIRGVDTLRLVAPNLTPDPETGSGTWPDDALARAIREGVGHDGRALRSMPWEDLRSLSDEDVASLVVYLRSVPAVRNPLPRRVLPTRMLANIAEGPEPLTEPVPERDLSDPAVRARYYIEITACRGCHSSWYSDLFPGLYGGGNEIVDSVFSSNITPDISGIGGWSEEQFIQIIRTGKAGTLDAAMPWVVFGGMSDADLGAIYQALREAPPVRHWINNFTPPTHCPVCLQEHGLGDANQPWEIVGIDLPRETLARYAGAYYAVDEVSDTVAVRLVDGVLRVMWGEPGLPMVPMSESVFHYMGHEDSSPTPMEFTLDAEGAVTGFIEKAGLERYTFRRVGS